MLQQPSEPIMYQKLPLDLNMHSAEVNNLQQDFKDIGLQLQAQKAAATQAFFLDAYSVRAAVPLSVSAVPVGAGIQGVYEAVYDPFLPHVQQHLQHHHLLHRHHHQQQQQQKPHQLLQIQQQPLSLLRQHQQQEQNHVPTVVGASSVQLWQQQQRQQLEKRGCWFPNWQEVFHGFAPSKEEKQGTHSSFQQQFAKQVAAEMPSVAAGAQALNARSLSSPLLDHSAAPLPHPPPVSEKKRNDIFNFTPHANFAQLRDGRFDRAESNGMSGLLPASSHFSTAIVPCSALTQEKMDKNSLVLRDPSCAGAIACRYITQSPAWLPQGWITEVQTRRTGATAGTRDKYYKDLMSGRRFRSKNEVIHYLQTGKGRLRSSRPRRRAIASSSYGGHVNFLTHEPQSLAQQETSSSCLFMAPHPIGFMLDPLVNTQPAHSLPMVQPMIGEEVEAPCQNLATNFNASSTPCQTPAGNSNSSSTPVVMLGHKRSGDSKPQKSPVQKKAKTLSPKKSEDKQASRLWQWLHKPVSKMEEQPQKHNAENLVSMAGEKKAPDRENQRKVGDLGGELQNMQGRAQIGRDIEAAQRTVSQLGKEMRAVIENLTQKIHTAKRDLKLEADATHETDNAMSNVMQATQGLDSAMGNLTEATQSFVLALDSAMHTTQASQFDVGKVSPAAKQPQAVASGVQRSLWPDTAMMQSASSSYAAQVAGWTNHLRGNVMQTHAFPNEFMTYATEPSQRPDNPRACITQATQFSDACARYYASEPPHGPHNSGSYITQAAQSSYVCAHYTIQRPDFAMCNSTEVPQSPIIVRNYAPTQATTSGIADATGTTPNVEKLSEDEHAYQKALEVSKQIMEERSRYLHKFSALNPELDLSLLSPSLSSRQRAKEVQKMKAKHTRGLLIILGRKLCHEAVQKSCEDGLKQG